jgi:hypothetical protein
MKPVENEDGVFSPKLQEHHQVSKNYNFYHFFGPYNPFEKNGIFSAGPPKSESQHNANLIRLQAY